MNSTEKVGEIFMAAGTAFRNLGDLTMQLNYDAASKNSKWTDEEIEMLLSAVSNFSQDLHKISVRIKNRTATQIRQSLRKRVFEEAGIAVKQVPVAIKVDNNGHAEPVLKSEPGMMVMMSSGCDDILNVDAQEVVGDDDDQLHDHKLTIMDHEKSSESELMCTLNEFNATADDLAIITTEEEEEEESTSPDCLSREQIKGIIE